MAKALLHLSARDLNLAGFSAGRADALQELFNVDPPSSFQWDDDEDPLKTFERFIEATAGDGDTYFACIGMLHKARLKYEKILSSQPIPTMEQVGPRGLLQYGAMDGSSLAGLLLWRKWMYDIDNRAAQETGYLFEPILASAIGGASAPASKSPVRRRADSKKGRQVDVVKGDFAYEMKLRVTIAASGQGRWREELDFPLDCVESGYTPVLTVLDGTANPKLSELVEAFTSVGGKAYVGEDAWRHLEDSAGPTMATFIDKYVKEPLQDLLASTPNGSNLPKLSLTQTARGIRFDVGDESWTVERNQIDDSLSTGGDELPDDVDDGVLGGL
ncbi:hypothetical protein [Prescottella sp. R16]|uniref:Restriction endonuclease n=1 Tax=Nocardia thailandica TaxID=257275 RepID=A0ABW6PH61_9NOCA|nr:hypothetical protein [Prescottella sp. R16]